MYQYVLEMEGICKEFPGVKALKNVDFKVKKGTIHALVGENGAGKSTLMKILNGIYSPDRGKIKFDGKEVEIKTPHDAIETGISMIHQELTPIPEMTIAENIFLGRETTNRFGLVDDQEINKKTEELLKHLDIRLNPKTKMKDLSIANTQMVEIAKAISYNSKLIIMDEPTSAITEKEVNKLFETMRALKKQGVSIIFITHRLNEIYEISDEITVLRDGEYVGTKAIEEVSEDHLIEMMVGRELKETFPKSIVDIGEVIFEVKNLSKQGVFEDINFSVKKGEIFGIAGLMGAGRTEVVESIFGITKPDCGQIFINGKLVDIKSPADAIKNGIGLLTEDRKLTGMFLPLTVRDNIIMANLNRFLKSSLFVNRRQVECDCNELIDQLKIKTPSLSRIAKFLSGGNQQKVLLARWLLTSPDILILDEPTRGIDVGAKAEIHKLIVELAKQGKAIIMISSELPEILGMSDRIAVMHEGKITGILSREEATQNLIMKYATGVM